MKIDFKIAMAAIGGLVLGVGLSGRLSPSRRLYRSHPEWPKAR
jgi:hypothetical protein